MTVMIDAPTIFTVADAADELDVTPGRIRQIARKHDIGRVIAGARLFTSDEMERLRRRPRGKGGRPKKIQNRT